MTNPLPVSEFQQALRKFADERDWHQYHTPKNLVMALAGEVGELTEIFQWLEGEASRDVMRDEKSAAKVREEIADVLGYVLRIADVLDIDLNEALWTKLKENARKYPVEQARGNAKKYTEFEAS